MSVLVIGKIQSDTDVFRRSLTERAGEYAKIAERSRAAGGIHRRFGIGDGFVVFIDEWESSEKFQTFFSDPEIVAFMDSVGAASAPPDLTIVEAVASPDQY